jgi:ABC-type glycerol-3-phosphate transport system substrate-binding protein
VTLPYYAQANISVISDDGMSTTIDSDEGIEAMKLMTELFNTYALPKQVNSFYNHFRYGTLPIGISNNENYVKLLIGAPEIKGNWDIALYPGIYNEETDEILRYAPTSSAGVMMFDSGEKNQEAFDFIQWWLSTEIQSRFAYDLQTMYGEEFIWFTANREAFSSLAIPENHKEIILQQYDWSIEAPNVPGIYMLEREISNVWNKIVLNNTNPRDTLEQSATIVNRELARKLEEFGYLDGTVLIKPYQVPSLNNIDRWLKEREGDGDGE